MKNIIFIFLSLIFSEKIAESYELHSIKISEPKNQTTKKQYEIKISKLFIAEREKFIDRCYRDSHGWSAGYGDFSWCNESIKVLIWKNPNLKKKSKDYVRSLVRISKDQAGWRLTKYITMIHDNLGKKNHLGNSLEEFFDEDQVKAIIDNIYTRGETNFYRGDFYKEVKEFSLTGKMNCLKIGDIILKESLLGRKENINGVLARRVMEWLIYTSNYCTYDINFILNTIERYRVKSSNFKSKNLVKNYNITKKNKKKNKVYKVPVELEIIKDKRKKRFFNIF